MSSQLYYVHCQSNYLCSKKDAHKLPLGINQHKTIGNGSQKLSRKDKITRRFFRRTCLADRHATECIDLGDTEARRLSCTRNGCSGMKSCFVVRGGGGDFLGLIQDFKHLSDPIISYFAANCSALDTSTESQLEKKGPLISWVYILGDVRSADILVSFVLHVFMQRVVDVRCINVGENGRRQPKMFAPIANGSEWFPHTWYWV